MVKTIISAIAAAIILVCGVIYENNFVTKTFDEFDSRLEILLAKETDKTATYDDALSLREFWHDKKKNLHVVIPHTEIKEIDLWLGETVALTQQENFEEASQKIIVLRELCSQIPANFEFKMGNIF